jgi:acylphosphatase
LGEKDRKCAHLFIAGRVQGVNFRYYTVQHAESLGVTGWVRNLWDGRVEAVLEGDETAVQQMVAWCREGPRAARVDDVEVHWEKPSDSSSGFTVRATSYRA